ncbi:cell wall metabolism sensor histidine kinase WalK [Inconstantimicrobium mannanitabidum]|uniref:PAS domain-containing sensor histidine kinase n=1 Tax=Inconstantimicrobium mannanitabidum TaxID=1604901 RepID=A0ACB5RFM1_9CLOT|nr:cell wall metabolism sensor histidine kinase WalK [Clostridium sp. TW13]GKX67889.1 PAS domain-containing sensor histidine kinase [Clostridium sp. TW13]
MIKSIKFKIFLILAVFVILTAGSSLVSIKYYHDLQQSIDLIMHSNYDSIVYAQNMLETLDAQDKSQMVYIFGNDTAVISDYESNRIQFLQWLNRAKGNITEYGEKETLDLIEKDYNKYVSAVNKFKTTKEKSSDNNSVDYYYSSGTYYYNNILPLYKDLKDNCRNLLDINEQSMLKMKDQSRNLANKAVYYITIISGLVLFVGIIVIGYLLKKIINPVEDLVVGINKVSEGKYEYVIPIRGEKEINYILESYNNMAKKLQEYGRLNVQEILREKQKAEAIIESIDSPIIVTDEDNKVIMLNKAGERVFDVKEKNIINTHFLEYIKQRIIFDMIKNSRNLSRENKEVNDIEMSQDNRNLYYRVITKPIWFEETENIGAITILQDITKFKEIDRLKSDFVSNVSHEFRTPLTSICMATGLLLEGNYSDAAEANELLMIIKEDSDKLDKLVRELLDLSKMESGKIEMEMKDVGIDDVINAVTRTFKIQLDEKNIKLIINTKGIRKKVKADVDKISWVIANLLGNALRYTNTDGTGIIEIKAREVNNTMLVAISDNGQGIAEEHQKIIFGKFIQVKDKDGQITGNSGLGLAICKEIVKAHLGEIWVESTLGKGSTFYFTLKLGEMLEE